MPIDRSRHVPQPQDVDDQDVKFLQHMEAIGTRRRRTETRVEPLPEESGERTLLPNETEDAVFDEYMVALLSGKAPPRPAAPPPTPAAVARRDAPPAAAPAAPDDDSKDPLLHGAERTLRRRLRKGEITPAAELDLHGKRRGEALNELDGFVKRSHKAGHEVVLVVTGRGLHSADLGVLKEMVPLLLQKRWPELVRQIVPAPPALGGEGAYIVFLRRR